MTFEIIDPTVSPQWLKLIGNSANATVFHHPGWIQALASTYHFKPLAIVALDETSESVGGIPFMEVKSFLTGKRLVSLPFTDYCLPLYGRDQVLRAMESQLLTMREERNCRYVELRYAGAGEQFREGKRYVWHRLALDAPEDAIFKKFDQKSVQWGIKKALKMGVQVMRGTDESLIREFIRLNAMTRKKHGIFPQPDKFFESIRRNLMEKDLGFIGAAVVEGKVVAASIFLHFNGKTFYKYNASDPRYYRYQPNNLILWDAIQWAIKARMEIFDFGRSDSENEGLVEFKRRWATTESELWYSFFPSSMSITEGFSDSWKTNAVRVVAQIVPSRFARTIGGIIYRHVG